jgi:hypothetical protein
MDLVTVARWVVAHTDRHSMATVLIGLVMELRRTVSRTRCHRTVVRPRMATVGRRTAAHQQANRPMVVVRQGLAMVVHREANGRIQCIPTSPPVMDGIAYRMKQLTRTTANRCLSIGTLRITPPIPTTSTEALPNSFVILKRHSAAIRLDMRILSNNMPSALIKWEMAPNTGSISR